MFLIVAALTMQPPLADQLREKRETLPATRRLIEEGLARGAPGDETLARAVMRQVEEAGLVWGTCVRDTHGDARGQSTTAEFDDALRRCVGDREEYLNWVRLGARVHGESPDDPRVADMVDTLERRMREAATAHERR